VSDADNRYVILDGFEAPDEVAEGYEMLKGPHGFECVLTEPEDRTFGRDLRVVVDKLNEQDAEIARLRDLVADQDDGGHWYSRALMGAVVQDRDRLREALEQQSGGWMDGYREGMNDSDAIYLSRIAEQDRMLRRAAEAIAAILDAERMNLTEAERERCIAQAEAWLTDDEAAAKEDT